MNDNREIEMRPTGKTVPVAEQRPAGRARVVPKLCGADVELGNFISGLDLPGGTGAEASRALLREIDGVPSRRPSSYGWNLDDEIAERRGGRSYAHGWYGYDSGHHLPWSGWEGYDRQDHSRRFLASNGGCCYIDLDHLEICLPEVRSARDFVAAWHAMLRIARGAMQASDGHLSEGQNLEVLANNSDGLGNSYGSHLSFLVGRKTWDALFRRQLHHMLFLASHQVSSIVFTGQGKVGSENGRPSVDFQISQRADFFETLTGTQTTYRRPLVNSRDEALCDGDLARLHVIFYDSTLCHVATFLKVGVMQIVLAMIEAGRVQPALILDDPLQAAWTWSHDRSLRARAPLVSGNRLTAVEHQLLLCDEAAGFVEAGGCAGSVPGASEIIALWKDTLDKLRTGDLESLVPRLDWVLKLSLLERSLGRRSRLDWNSPEIKHLDQVYSSLDPARGLYWACERSGLVERVADRAAIERLIENPPEDTRACVRAHALRALEPEDIQEVNWDRIRFRSSSRPRREWVIDLGNPMVNELIKRPGSSRGRRRQAS